MKEKEKWAEMSIDSYLETMSKKGPSSEKEAAFRTINMARPLLKYFFLAGFDLANKVHRTGDAEWTESKTS